MGMQRQDFTGQRMAIPFNSALPLPQWGLRGLRPPKGLNS